MKAVNGHNNAKNKGVHLAIYRSSKYQHTSAPLKRAICTHRQEGRTHEVWLLRSKSDDELLFRIIIMSPHGGGMENIMEKNHFDSILKALILFCIGGIAYLLIEILWRGHSHWSMFFLGGACFFIVGLINEHSDYNAPLVFEMILASFIITTLEFIAGYILNIRLNLNVWDYSDLPFNIMGQVCLPYMGLWFVLSFFCIMIDDALRRYLFGEEKKEGLFKNSR